MKTINPSNNNTSPLSAAADLEAQRNKKTQKSKP